MPEEIFYHPGKVCTKKVDNWKKINQIINGIWFNIFSVNLSYYSNDYLQYATLGAIVSFKYASFFHCGLSQLLQSFNGNEFFLNEIHLDKNYLMFVFNICKILCNTRTSWGINTEETPPYLTEWILNYLSHEKLCKRLLNRVIFEYIQKIKLPWGSTPLFHLLS